MNNEEESRIIEEDRASHPNCNYSISSSHSCSSRDGDMVCEALKHIYRNCPGEKAEPIYSSKSNTKGDNSLNDGFGSASLFDSDGRNEIDIFDLFSREFGGGVDPRRIFSEREQPQHSFGRRKAKVLEEPQPNRGFGFSFGFGDFLDKGPVIDEVDGTKHASSGSLHEKSLQQNPKNPPKQPPLPPGPFCGPPKDV